MILIIKSLLSQMTTRTEKTFLNSNHGVKKKIKTAYDKYLQYILGLNGESGEKNQAFSRKKLFSFLKSSRTDAQGIAVLIKGDKTCTNDVDQANLLNSLHSVFSCKSTLRPFQTLSYHNVEWCNPPC